MEGMGLARSAECFVGAKPPTPHPAGFAPGPPPHGCLPNAAPPGPLSRLLPNAAHPDPNPSLPTPCCAPDPIPWLLPPHCLAATGAHPPRAPSQSEPPDPAAPYAMPYPRIPMRNGEVPGPGLRIRPVQPMAAYHVVARRPRAFHRLRKPCHVCEPITMAPLQTSARRRNRVGGSTCPVPQAHRDPLVSRVARSLCSSPRQWDSARPSS